MCCVLGSVDLLRDNRRGGGGVWPIITNVSRGGGGGARRRREKNCKENIVFWLGWRPKISRLYHARVGGGWDGLSRLYHAGGGGVQIAKISIT